MFPGNSQLLESFMLNLSFFTDLIISSFITILFLTILFLTIQTQICSWRARMPAPLVAVNSNPLKVLPSELNCAAVSLRAVRATLVN